MKTNQDNGGLKSTPLLTSNVIKTLSERMTPARVKKITHNQETITHEICCQLWVADLLLGILPEYPEGIISSVQLMIKSPSNKDRPCMLGVMDSRFLGITDFKGAYDIVNDSHEVNHVVTNDNWFYARYYNLLLLYDNKFNELEGFNDRLQSSGSLEK